MPVIEGKFFSINHERFHIKGVTYGTFQPDGNGVQFPCIEKVENDFRKMSETGINAIRTYTIPSRAILDMANVFGIKVMIGLPWEQHLTFLDSRKSRRQIIGKIRSYVEHCHAHPAILCYTIGNEIPASIVRWYGERKIRNFLRKIYFEVKNADPEALVTYVNYPTTEYLELPFLDFYCFNVYLESKEKLSSYLSRLHNLVGDKPLVLTEIGLDSLRNGKDRQAEILNWQLRTTFEKGCAGAFVFSWTDEWWRGGMSIEDWDFGLVDRTGNPKPSLETVRKVYDQIPYVAENQWPKFSIVVCSHNGASTIKDTLDACTKLEYPDYEVIVGQPTCS